MVGLLLLPLQQAIIVSVVWGYVIIGVLSYFMARAQKTGLLGVIGEHLLIATVVVVGAHWVGVWIKTTFA